MLWIMEYNEYGYFPKYDKDIDNAINNIKIRIQCNEMISEKRKAAGRKGGNPNLVKQNPILDNQKVKQNEISDNNNIIDNNNILNNNKEKINKKESKKEKAEAELKKRAQKFYDSLIPFLDSYDKEMLREFYDYWSEPNKSHSKMRWEQERTWDLKRRLARWANNDKKRNYGNNKPAKPTLEETAAELVESYLNGSRITPSISDFG